MVSLWWEWQENQRGICCFYGSKKAENPVKPWESCESRQVTLNCWRVPNFVSCLCRTGKRLLQVGLVCLQSLDFLTMSQNCLHKGDTMGLILCWFTLTFPPAHSCSPMHPSIWLPHPLHSPGGFQVVVQNLLHSRMQLFLKHAVFSSPAIVPSHTGPVAATAATIRQCC